MEFLKKHGEKILFLVLLSLLALSAVVIMGRRNGFERVGDLALRERESDVGKDTEGLDRLLARLTTDPYRVEPGMSTFTASTRVMCVNPADRALIPADAKECPYCGVTQERDVTIDTDGDGIPDDVERTLELDPEDPADVYLDQDGDGFPTLYEYRNGTDPRDADDHPPLIEYLRLTDTEETSVEFELRGTAKFGQNYTLQLAWNYPGQDRWQTDYIKVGNRFGRQNEFLAKSFTEDIVPRDGRFVDESVAVIESGRHQLKLSRVGEGRSGKISEIVGTVSLILGPEWEREVRYGDSFSLDKNSYKVVDIDSGTVVLQPDQSGDRITVRPPTSRELEELKPPEPDPMDPREGGEFFDENMGFDPNDLPF